jgi:hypothetical protein
MPAEWMVAEMELGEKLALRLDGPTLNWTAG